MPIYQYKCPVCKVEVEIQQKFDDPAPYCQDCWTDTKPGRDENPILMERQIGQTSFILKGKGWSRDGYK